MNKKAVQFARDNTAIAAQLKALPVGHVIAPTDLDTIFACEALAKEGKMKREVVRGAIRFTRI
jgi:hypothetical protein